MSDTKKSPLRIGVLGFGAMGRTHTWAVQNIPFFYQPSTPLAISYGVCTTTMEKSQRIAKEYGFALATDNEDDLINNPDIDIIDICTPNIYHFETLKKAIASGKHVLCEKPLCVTKEQADEIAALPRKAGQVCGMVFNNRYLAPVMRAKQLIEEGRLGRILSFRGEYLHSSATDIHRAAGWKQDRTVCGGGVLFDLGSHVIDLLTHLCGPFEAVSGLSQIAYPTRLGRNGEEWTTNADEAFYMMAKAKSGAHGTLAVGKLMVGTNDDLKFEIYGEKGALKFSLMDPGFLEFYDATLQEQTLGGNRGFVRIECIGRYPDMKFPSPKAPVGWLNGHLASMYAFLSAARDGAVFEPSLEAGAQVQAVMDAAYRSAQAGGVMTEVL
jgi:predicted dehydrogenase